MTVNEKIRALRKERGLSQEDLAEKLSVSRQAVSKWESGETTPEVSKLIELSRIFQISLDDLLEVHTPPNGPDSTGGEKDSAPQGLTEHQWMQLEALLREQQAQQPKPRRRWPWALLCGALALALVILWAAFSGQLRAMQQRIDSVQNSVGSLSGQLQSQIAGIESGIQDSLEAQASLLADSRCFVSTIDPGTRTMTLSLRALPKPYEADMSLSFSVAIEDGQTFQAPATPGEDYGFTAEITVPLSNEVAVSAVLDYGEGKSIEQLDTLYSYADAARMEIFTYLNYSASYTPGADILSIRSTQLEVTFTPGWPLDDILVYPVSGELEVYQNDTLLETIALELPSREEVEKYLGYTSIASLPDVTLYISEEETLSGVLTLTDNWGQVYTGSVFSLSAAPDGLASEQVSADTTNFTVTPRETQ